MPPTEERRKQLVELFNGAPIKKATGMAIRYDGEGRAIFEMPYNPSFDHALGAIHGSVFGMMIDNAGWFTVAPHYANWIVTVEFSTRLHEPVARENLWSIGRIVRLGGRVASAEMEVRTANNQLVATGAGSFIVTSTPYEN